MKKYIAIIGAILLIAAASTAYALNDYYWNDAKVTGGGSIDVLGGYATFGIVSQEGVYKGSNGVKGNMEYVNHVTGENLHFYSDSIQDLKCTRTTSDEPSLCNAAEITYLVYDQIYVVYVEDNGEPGSSQATGSDKFEIRIGSRLDGSKLAGGTLTGGNIQIFGEANIPSDFRY